MQIGKDQNTPPSTNYIGERHNSKNQVVGYFKYSGGKGILIKKKDLEESLNGTINGAPEQYDTLPEIANALSGLASVAFSGDYTDLSNTPNERTFKEFKSSWPTSTTLSAFCSAVINDPDAKVGNAYLGGLSCTGLPTGMGQGDVVVEIIGTNNNKVVKLTLTSTDVSPYHGEGCYGQGSFRGGKSFELQSNKTTSLTSSSTDTEYPSAKAVYDNVVNKQRVIVIDNSSNTSAITNPQEGDIEVFPMTVSADNLQNVSASFGTSNSLLAQAKHTSVHPASGYDWSTVILWNTFTSAMVCKFIGYDVLDVNDQIIGTLPDVDAGYAFVIPGITWGLTYYLTEEGVSPQSPSTREYLLRLFSGINSECKEYVNGAWVDRKPVPDLSGYVSTSAQTFTDAQKAQARTNIGAAGASDVTGKADKVSNGTENNFAALDANGNLKDSGHKHSDYLTSHQDISGKEDKSNKVTSFGSTPSDTKYPSEKLVKDSLDAKQPTIDNEHKLAYSLISDTPIISTNIQSDKASDAKTASPKAVYDEVHPAIASSQPAGGMLPNVLYNLGTLSGDTTFTLASASDANIANHYYWTFDTPSTAPTITWPAAITSWNGGSAPTINASKHYEISVLNGIGCYMEV